LSERFADLHLHTNFSDGTYSPEDLVVKALDNGLNCISLTDHDTVEGLERTISYGDKKGIEVIPGIEVSAQFDSVEVHILGYFIDYKSDFFLERLKELKLIRVERIYRIAEKLNNLGLNISAKDILSLAEGSTVGRLHVAKALLSKGFVNSIYEAFDKYIGDNGPAYVLGFRFTPKDAIDFIKKAKGIPVLAHPYVFNNDEIILEFIKSGLLGLEVYYPEHSQGEVNFYLNMAKEHNLLVTGGSDCHGSGKPKERIGSIKIPYRLVEELKEYKERLV